MPLSLTCLFPFISLPLQVLLGVGQVPLGRGTWGAWLAVPRLSFRGLLGRPSRDRAHSLRPSWLGVPGAVATEESKQGLGWGQQ